MSILRAVGVTTLFSGAAAALGGVCALYTIRQLSPSDWGTAAVLAAAAVALNVVLSAGSVTRHVRLLATVDDASERRNTTSYFIGSRVPWVLLLALLGVALRPLETSVSTVLIVSSLLFFRGPSTVLFIAEGRFRRLGTNRASEKLVTLVILVGCGVTDSFGPSTYPLAQGAAAGAMGLSLVLQSGVHLPTALKGSLRPFSGWSNSLHYGMVSIMGALQQIDVALVRWLAGGTASGLYATGSRLTSPLNILGSSASTVILPLVARGAPSTSDTLKRSRVLTVLLLPVCVLLSLAATTPWWTSLVAGDDYARAAWPVSAFLLGAVGMNLLAPCVAYLQGKGKALLAGRLVVGQTLTSLAAIAIGALLEGANGAAAGYFIVNSCAAIVGIYLTRREMGAPQ